MRQLGGGAAGAQATRPLLTNAGVHQPPTTYGSGHLGAWHPSWGPVMRKHTTGPWGQGCCVQEAGRRGCLEGQGVQSSYEEGWTGHRSSLGARSPPQLTQKLLSPPRGKGLSNNGC